MLRVLPSLTRLELVVSSEDELLECLSIPACPPILHSLEIWVLEQFMTDYGEVENPDRLASIRAGLRAATCLTRLAFNSCIIWHSVLACVPQVRGLSFRDTTVLLKCKEELWGMTSLASVEKLSMVRSLEKGPQVFIATPLDSSLQQLGVHPALRSLAIGFLSEKDSEELLLIPSTPRHTMEDLTALTGLTSLKAEGPFHNIQSVFSLSQLRELRLNMKACSNYDGGPLFDSPFAPAITSIPQLSNRRGLRLDCPCCDFTAWRGLMSQLATLHDLTTLKLALGDHMPVSVFREGEIS
jgi:hypothetical protein